MAENDRTFYAYELVSDPKMPLLTAPVDRLWMQESPDRFAYRCLPLNIANQAGWVIPCPVSFSAIWDGGLYAPSVRIAFETPEGHPWITSHFGCGVVTIALPYLFRTPRGVNLWCKGPANWIKHGIQPLEGIIETDWSAATFTMNWKLTQPNQLVFFEKGEPICMLVPMLRGLAEGLDPVWAPIDANPELRRQFQQWDQSRAALLNERLYTRDPEVLKRGWQRDYLKGEMPDGSAAPEHQTRLHLKEFHPDET
jgi:hypothetical protein